MQIKTTMKFHPYPRAIIKKTGGAGDTATTMEISTAVPQKNENRPTWWPGHSILGTISEGV
jgi:hypothetical protein